MSYGKTASLAALLAACCLAAPGARATPLDPMAPVTPIKPVLPRPPIVIDWCKRIFDPLFQAASRGDFVGARVVFNDGSSTVVTYLDAPSLSLTAGGNLFGQAQQLSSHQGKGCPAFGPPCKVQWFDVNQAGIANIAVTPAGKMSIVWVSNGGGGVDYKPTCKPNKTVVISYGTYTGVASFSWAARPH